MCPPGRAWETSGRVYRTVFGGRLCGILDSAGFFAPLRALLDEAVTAGFVHPAHRDMVIVDDDPALLLDRLAAWTPATVSKWLDGTDR